MKKVKPLELNKPKLKMLIPTVALFLLFGTWSLIFVKGDIGSKFDTSPKVLVVVASAVIFSGFFVDPYSQFTKFEGSFQNYPDRNGLKYSLIHWLVLLTVYYFIVRPFPLKKSLLVFVFLGERVCRGHL